MQDDSSSELTPGESTPDESTPGLPTESTSKEEKQPWFADGLHFQCTGCGNCCTGAPGAVWVDEGEVELIAAQLKKTVDEIRLMYTRPLRGKVSLIEHSNGDCVFFDTKTRGCTIYEARPKQCKTWPFWNSNLRTPQEWINLGRECPGAGKGDLVSLEEIQQRASQVDL